VCASVENYCRHQKALLGTFYFIFSPLIRSASRPAAAAAAAAGNTFDFDDGDEMMD
jgi:hypothetical protein